MTHLHSLHFAKRLRRLINNTLKVFISETKNTPCTNINSAGVFCFTCTRRSPSPAAGAARGALALAGRLCLRGACTCGVIALAGYLCLRDVCTCGALVLAGRLHLRGAYISWENVYLHEILQKMTPFSCIFKCFTDVSREFQQPQKNVKKLNVGISTILGHVFFTLSLEHK